MIPVRGGHERPAQASTTALVYKQVFSTGAHRLWSASDPTRYLHGRCVRNDAENGAARATQGHALHGHQGLDNGLPDDKQRDQPQPQRQLIGYQSGKSGESGASGTPGEELSRLRRLLTGDGDSRREARLTIFLHLFFSFVSFSPSAPMFPDFLAFCVHWVSKYTSRTSLPDHKRGCRAQ